jgi:hypothetical protein
MTGLAIFTIDKDAATAMMLVVVLIAMADAIKNLRERSLPSPGGIGLAVLFIVLWVSEIASIDYVTSATSASNIVMYDLTMVWINADLIIMGLLLAFIVFAILLAYED